jgi:acyl transferase domain-containing protein
MMAGHSIGEFVAATLAGVWDLEDVLRIVALRGRLMHDLPRGSMMAVNSSAESIESFCPHASDRLKQCSQPVCRVRAGAECPRISETTRIENIIATALHTSHAFHSAMMDPIIEPLREAIAKMQLRAPEKPFVSTVTGLPITAAEQPIPRIGPARRATVEFGKAIQYLKEQGLRPLPRMRPALHHVLADPQAIHARPSLHGHSHPWPIQRTTTPSGDALLFALGSLWQNGVSISWDALLHARRSAAHSALPTYPFERQRFWVDPAPVAAESRSL